MAKSNGKKPLNMEAVHSFIKDVMPNYQKPDASRPLEFKVGVEGAQGLQVLSTTATEPICAWVAAIIIDGEQTSVVLVCPLTKQRYQVEVECPECFEVGQAVYFTQVSCIGRDASED